MKTRVITGCETKENCIANCKLIDGTCERPEYSDIELFARKCDGTGKGMNMGFYLDGSYACNQIQADKICKTRGFKDYEQAYNEDSDIYYYTEWEELDDTYAYDFDGNEYNKTETGEWVRI